jgi:hypothetical protein
MKYSIITGLLAATLTLFTTIAKAQETPLSCSIDSQNFITNKILKAEKIIHPHQVLNLLLSILDAVQPQ